VAAVHHCGKEASRGARGSSALKAAADVEIFVEGSKDRRTATVTKSKDGEDGISLAFRLDSVEIGPDMEASSCVVEVLSGWSIERQTRRTVKLTDAQKAAFGALKNALAEAGERMPPSNQRPDKTGCPSSLWFRYCEQSKITASDNPDSFRRSFDRATAKLKQLGIIGSWGGWVWLND
jgi:hypothetical protein